MQDLLLQFHHGRMSGMGHDELGQFEINGSYDETSKEAQWLKLYPDGHQVSYRAFVRGQCPASGACGRFRKTGLADSTSGRCSHSQDTRPRKKKPCRNE